LVRSAERDHAENRQRVNNINSDNNGQVQLVCANKKDQCKKNKKKGICLADRPSF